MITIVGFGRDSSDLKEGMDVECYPLLLKLAKSTQRPTDGHFAFSFSYILR